MFVGCPCFSHEKTNVVFLWHDPKMTSREKVVINQLRWERKLLQMEIKEMQNMREKNDRICEEDNEVNNFDQHNSLKAQDWLGTNEMNDLKMNEMKKELNDLKTSFRWKMFALKCCALFCVYLSFDTFILMWM